MSRILFATIGSLGDLHPLIAIALELRQRGHTVRFCTSASYRPRLEALGFGFDPLRPDATPENESLAEMVRQILDPRRGAERLLRGVIMPRLRETYQDLRQAAGGPPPTDLLVCGELVYPAPVVAEKLGLRWATCITAPMSFFSAYDPPVLAPVPRLSRILRRFGPSVNTAAIRLIKFATRNWSQPVRQLRAELGLGPGQDPIYEGKFSPHGVLALFSTVLARAQPDWPPNTVITGFPFYDGAPTPAPLASELARFLEQGPPPIVFTLGSSAVLDPGEFYQESAQAAALLKRRAILLVGPNPAPTPLPPGVASFGYLRFSELFPHAAAVVHQGGIGTTGQVLRAGCPMLVMPFNFDQPDNATRIVRLGAGRTLSRSRYSAHRVVAELRLLLEAPHYRAHAKELSLVVASESGVATAADSLERLLPAPATR